MDDEARHDILLLFLAGPAFAVEAKAGSLPSRSHLAELVDVGISEHTREVCNGLRAQETHSQPHRREC